MDIVELILSLLGSILIVVINAIIIGIAIYYTIKLAKIIWVSIDVNKQDLRQKLYFIYQ